MGETLRNRLYSGFLVQWSYTNVHVYVNTYVFLPKLLAEWSGVTYNWVQCCIAVQISDLHGVAKSFQAKLFSIYY